MPILLTVAYSCNCCLFLTPFVLCILCNFMDNHSYIFPHFCNPSQQYESAIERREKIYFLWKFAKIRPGPRIIGGKAHQWINWPMPVVIFGCLKGIFWMSKLREVLIQWISASPLLIVVIGYLASAASNASLACDPVINQLITSFQSWPRFLLHFVWPK